jgi:hypothetical protein
VNETRTQTPPGAANADARQHRLELARKAFKEFSAQCFWSAPADLEVTEADIPFIIRGLRLHGGHRGYRLAAELCR